MINCARCEIMRAKIKARVLRSMGVPLSGIAEALSASYAGYYENAFGRITRFPPGTFEGSGVVILNLNGT
jgi:hypothetical protein